jgi:hypothetical protein
MDYLDAVRQYVTDAYPTNTSVGSWRSNANISAVNLLRTRVQNNERGNTRSVVEFLLDGNRPPEADDPEVAALADINETGFFRGESRLQGLLHDLRAALAIPTDFNEFHLRRIWGSNTIVLTGVLASTELNTLGWLSYFYKEKGAFQHLTVEDKVCLVDFLNVFYTLPPILALHADNAGLFADAFNGGDFLNQGNPLPQRIDNGQTVFQRLNNFTNENLSHEYRVKRDVFRGALDAMLRSGFVPIAQTNVNHSITGATPGGTLVNFPRWGNNTAARVQQAALRTNHASFCWRGESRTYEEVRTVGGLWCKAASDGYAPFINMRKDWHPFSDATKRGYVYFRCNQDDNCLYTAVSATPAVTLGGGPPVTFQFNALNVNAFRVNVTFPQLDEIPVVDRNLVRIRVTPAGGGIATHHCYVDEVQLFLCAIPHNTSYVDTHRLQGGNGFPEIALRGIPYRNIVGYLKFIRVHHGNDNVAGFTAIPVDDFSRNLDATDVAETTLYNAANIQFEAAWGPNGHIPPGIVWNGQWVINEVGGMAVAGNGRIAQYRNYR